MTDQQRRRFMKTSAVAAAATIAAPAVIRAQNANDRIRVAVVGMGGRARRTATV